MEMESLVNTNLSSGATGSTPSRLLYQPLPGQRSFRLLELLPGQWDDPIQFNLLLDDLDSLSHPYEAISYTWGDATDRKAIKCNGNDGSITRSLFDALRAFRRDLGENARILWADDVCIDQSNTPERSLQIQLMEHIYRAAGKVQIWLGEGDAAKIQPGLQLVGQIAFCIAEQEREHASQMKDTHGDAPEAHYMWRDDDASAPYTISCPDADFEVTSLRPLCALFECRWFTRLWVIQELVLSAAAEMHWGKGSIDFMLVGQAATYVLDHQKSDFVQYEAFDGLKRCYNMFGMWINRWTALSLFDLLWLSRSFGATDPRDKIFGMLGLPTSDSVVNGAPFMKPDYSLSTAEVYTHVASKILVDHNEIDLLATVQHGRELRQNWTSWVPDWSSRHTNCFCNSGRKTSGEVSSCIRTVPAEYGFLNILSVQGIIIDSIATLIDVNFDQEDHWWHRRAAEALVGLIRKVEPTFGAGRTAHTLTAGLGTDGYLVDDTEAFMLEYTAFRDWDFESNATLTSPPTKGLSDQDDDQIHAGYQFFANSGPTILKRRCFETRSGMLGLGPLATAAEDIVVVLFGGTVPFVLRPDADDQRYRLVGECYVHDIMNGEAVVDWLQGGQPAVDFQLY